MITCAYHDCNSKDVQSLCYKTTAGSITYTLLCLTCVRRFQTSINLEVKPDAKPKEFPKSALPNRV
jgi:hypothetical protein